MNIIIYIYTLLQINFIYINTIWPPPYKINLTQNEEFVIGESVESNENDWFNLEDEMIEANDIKGFELEKDEYKFANLDKQAKRYNDKQQKKNEFYSQPTNFTNKRNEMLAEDWNAGFVDKNNNFIENQDNKNVIFSNKIATRMVEQNIREKHENKDDPEYNYEELDKEYKMSILKEQQMNNTFNSTNIKDDKESFKEAMGKIVDFKTEPRNCTKEELSGIGFAAAKCIWIDLKHAETRETKWQLLLRIRRICMIWFFIYFAIAVPCWCHKGWCCCCFQCKFCKPRNRINTAKTYLMNNPPGTYVSADKKTITYKPTVYENDAYAKLKRTLMQL